MCCLFCILRNFIEIVILLCLPDLLAYGLALFSEFALLRSQIWKRDSFALVVRNSAMQISRFTKIVIFVSSLGFTFFSCIALFDLLVLLGFTVTFALFVRMRWGVSLLRERPRALPFGFPQAFEKA